jgi:alkylhydroperoxidase family enzyme
MRRSQRLAVEGVDPSAHDAVRGIEANVRAWGLEPGLLELIRIRASQLNGCAYCLDMHNHDARRR